ncbi:hypothetical protein FHS39_000475 [Streptomyces olivoverticillatus]|uniref:Putative zinc-finger domain-containing protein n=1 Tax=Streptomyces olivoverticillatus TaxID=66427 RepID=A0A7W7LJN4_9ACTN|nr:hypothetical protein [Streptomyces olivoverticillatus]
MTGSGGQSPAEHHLGDRLAALVDGELGHDSRERVLAHLATCWKCKAEADAQRRLKNAFAQAAPPPLSDSLLARLQGLPGGGTGEGGGRFGPPAGDGEDDAEGRGRGGAAETFVLLPAVGPQPRERGFRIHEAERGSVRGRRFAFAAAGAVSLAAFALVGAQPLGSPGEVAQARGGDAGTATTSLAMTPGQARAEQRGPARSLAAPAATPFLAAALLRPSDAPVLPPLLRTARSFAPAAPAQPEAAQQRATASH